MVRIILEFMKFLFGHSLFSLLKIYMYLHDIFSWKSIQFEAFFITISLISLFSKLLISSLLLSITHIPYYLYNLSSNFPELLKSEELNLNLILLSEVL